MLDWLLVTRDCEALQTEISLQPWRAFKPDGVILFSDILTPLTGMNIPFDILPKIGPVIENPIRDMKVMPALADLEGRFAARG